VRIVNTEQDADGGLKGIGDLIQYLIYFTLTAQIHQTRYLFF
jgi:hypothetical protein